VFETLSDKLQSVFRTLRGHGSLSESDVDSALREIRLALLEADVHFKVVKDFLERVRARATGQDALKSLTPGQAVVRVVRDEMVALLGGQAEARLRTSPRLPSVSSWAPGMGKTTTAPSSPGGWARRAITRCWSPRTSTVRRARPARVVGGQPASRPSSGRALPPGHPALGARRGALSGPRVRHRGHSGRLHIDDELMNSSGAESHADPKRCCTWPTP
jgi:signal recognition particle subunit SRP54